MVKRNPDTKLRVLEDSVRELTEAKAMAEAADHAKSSFLAAMSHELRTPLTAIIGFSELLEDGTGGPLNERQKKYVANILESGRTLLDLIDQVLDITRVQVGRMALSLSPVEVAETVRDVMMLIRPLAAKRDIGISIAVEGELPRISADAPKLKQVLFGLAANAIRHTPASGSVVIGARRLADGDGIDPGEWVEIQVTDSGAGIRAADRERLLTNFGSVDAGEAPAVRTGFGMSLALARKLIELHGGRLWLEGAEPNGTTVRFVLPRQAKGAAPEAPARPRDEQGPPRPVVLVIEDDPQTGELLQHVLEQAGYAVEMATTAAQGRRLALALQPVAITLDPALPDCDGLEMLAELRKQGGARLPVVVVSVSNQHERGAGLDIAAWITKPVDRAKLLGALERIRSARP